MRSKFNFTAGVTSAVLAFVLSVVLAHGAGSAASCDTLLFAYFRGSEELLYAYSSDGLHWTDINRQFPVLNTTIPSTSIRDPFINRGADGTFYLVTTNGNAFGGTPTILTWSSADLVTWSPEFVADVMGPAFFPPPAAVHDVWAPEWRFDDATGAYMVFWSARGDNLFVPAANCTGTQASRFAFFRSWTTDFKNFSQPEVFFDPACFFTGDGGIDGDLVQDEGGRFVFVYKDARGVGEGHAVEVNRGIRLAVSTGGIDGPYPNASISEFLCPTLVEAPELVFFGGRWLLYYDCSFFPVPPGDPRPPYGVSESASLAGFSFAGVPGACTGNGTDVSFPVGATHGSFVCISTEELQAILARFPPSA